MKGLLLKDFYLLTKYCRVFLMAILVFTLVACVQKENTFFIFYPVVMAGMIPMTIYSYDEREKWSTYSLALPYTREQLVSVKYVIGFLSCLGVTGIVALAQAFFLSYYHIFIMQDYVSMLAVMLMLGLLGPSILMPFVFRFGAEKGRIAYYIVIFSCFALCVMIMDSDLKPFLYNNLRLGIMVVFMFGIYLMSWLLSIALYKKREL